MRELEMQLPPSAASVPRARSALRTTFGTGESAAGGLVELLTCELVSNVVRHVGQPMTVRAVFGHSVRVEVDDPSTDVPVLAVPATSPDGGYGLRLIDALSSDWGV